MAHQASGVAEGPTTLRRHDRTPARRGRVSRSHNVARAGPPIGLTAILARPIPRVVRLALSGDIGYLNGPSRKPRQDRVNWLSILPREGTRGVPSPGA